jgi:hypothetical protein
VAGTFAIAVPGTLRRNRNISERNSFRRDRMRISITKSAYGATRLAFLSLQFAA